MSEIKNKVTLNIILVFSIFVLIVAYFIEYFLKHEPCNLCLIERIPYIFSITIILICLFLKKFEKITFLLLALIFIFGTIISFYHVGIERGFFEESFLCNLRNEINILTKEDLLKELQKKIISCKKVDFTIFGLSLASINTIVSIILSSITFKMYLNYEKNQ
tara:strand:- start:76 stop:561 length:486 start_codon:yes stop_codon:yes gene_type:complete